METGGISFLTKPPKGLLEAVDARVIELRKAEKKDLVPEKVVENIDEIKAETKEEIDKLAEEAKQKADTRKGICFLGGTPKGTRYTMVSLRRAVASNAHPRCI